MKIIIAVLAVVTVVLVGTSSSFSQELIVTKVERENFFGNYERLNSNQVEEQVKDKHYFLLKENEVQQWMQKETEEIKEPARILIAGNPCVVVYASYDSYGDLKKSFYFLDEHDASFLGDFNYIIAKKLTEKGTQQVPK